MSTFHDPERVRVDDEHTEESDLVRILDPDGRPLPGAEVPDLTDEQFRTLYEHVVTARHFDERALSLQRQGRIATYAPMTGQEGAQVAATMPVTDDDWLFPTYREHAVKYVAGMDFDRQLRTLRGVPQEPGVEDGPTLMPEAIPIATQLPHAVGVGMAKQYRGEAGVAVAHFGDGATSEGDFHEALNFAGVYDAPAVFVCHNNQWAISMPRERQTASATLAQKAEAYGFEGVRVDGLDPLAVYSVVGDAIAKARDPDDDERRPTLVESVEYRFGAHTTADDPSVYRDDDDADCWRDRDALERLEAFLRETGRLDDERDEAIRARAEQRVADAIHDAEAASAGPEALFEHAYADLPDRVREQMDYLARLRERHGDDALRRD